MHQQATRSLLVAHGRRTPVQLHLFPAASTTSPVALHWLYFNCVVRRDYSSYGRIGSTSSTSHTVATLSLGRVGSTTIMSCATTTHLPTTAALPQLRCASRCLGTSRGSSRGSSRRLSSTTSPRAVSYAARPGASGRRAARRATRHRLLRLRCASGCLSTSLGSSCGSSSTTSPRAGSYAAHPGASARRVARRQLFRYATRPGASAHRTARHAARRRLLRLAQARRDYFASRRLVRHASRCLGMTRGSSRGSSSTTSPTPRVWVPRHVARLVSSLVVGYFT
jgi:hypothetical protein